MYRVIRFCCRCAPDRGQATLLQGIRGVVRFCVERTSRGSVACPAIGDVNPGYAVCLMHCVTRFCCRCAPDRGQATLLQGFMALSEFVSIAELVGASLLAIGDAVVVHLGHAICLKYRVIRCCCRCAPDRGQATLLQGMCGVARICVERRICGSELARDRRRSRRKPRSYDLPEVPRHPMLLPLRARSRASHAPRGIYGVARICVERRICGSELVPRSATQSS